MTEEQVATKITELEQRVLSNAHRITDLEELQKSVNNLAISVNTLANNMQQMLSEQRDQGQRLKVLEEQPGERWNNMQRTVFNTVLGAISSALAIGIIQLIVSNM
ncbi:MAG: hypothetical protein ACI4D9_03875 [Lachnospiraceae bacterium]